MKSGSLNLLEHSGPVQASNGITLRVVAVKRKGSWGYCSEITKKLSVLEWLVFIDVGYVYDGNRAVGLGVLS
jgi:hypothetical protein